MASKLFEKLLANIPVKVKSFNRISMEISATISDILKEKGISQKELADLMQKRESEISKWLSGNHNFTIRSLAKLEEALKTQIVFTKFDRPNITVQVEIKYSEPEIKVNKVIEESIASNDLTVKENYQVAKIFKINPVSGYERVA